MSILKRLIVYTILLFIAQSMMGTYARTRVVFASDTLVIEKPDMRIDNSVQEKGDDGFMIGVFDYMNEAYSSHGFYQTGYWGKKYNEDASPVYHGKLPDYAVTSFIRPAEGNITSRFGYRQQYRRMHKGVDLKLNIGDTVKSALPGIVKIVGNDPGGYGNYIIITQSEGVETRYGHLSKTIVEEGAKVCAGQAVALGGNTGNSTGAHLHFEARRYGLPLDPLLFFDF